jgi:hypothetical protein
MGMEYKRISCCSRHLSVTLDPEHLAHFMPVQGVALLMNLFGGRTDQTGNLARPADVWMLEVGTWGTSSVHVNATTPDQIRFRRSYNVKSQMA